jgi:signal transduction histidine kinase/ActR/RegA family two-component response regulator
MDRERQMKIIPSTLSGRLGLYAMGIHILLAPLLMWALTGIVTKGYQDQFVNQSRSTAFLLRSLIEAEMDRADGHKVEDMLAEPMLAGDVIYAELRLPSGESIMPDVNAVPGNAGVLEDFRFNENNDEIYFVATSLSYAGTSARLWLGFDENPTSDIIAVAHRRLLLFAVLYLILNVLLSVFTGRHLTKELRILQQTARKITSGSKTERLQIKTGIDEFSNLALDLDEMHNTLETQRQIMTAARDSAVAASLAKSQFLAHMSHEIRTPMNGVLGMTELLAGTDLNSIQRKYTGTILHSAESLLGIINDILDFSKIEAGKMTLAMGPFDLQDVLLEATELLLPQASSKGLELVTELPASFHRTYTGDNMKLRQILINLLGNAVKFTYRGRIVLRVSEQAVAASATHSRLYFEIEDTGIGISHENQAAIFESFRQADSSLTRKYGGTGLGLAICRQLVELMGGEIGISSQPGKGSTFWFTINLVCEEALKVPCKPATTTSAAKKLNLHVLVVEDNPVNQLVASGMLKQQGCSVVMASDGLEGVTAFKAGKFDVVFMDCQMPVMDGYEATAQIRAHDRMSNNDYTPVVALTAFALEDDRLKCEEAGMDLYLSKPFSSIQLHTVLRAAIAAKSVKSPGMIAVP